MAKYRGDTRQFTSRFSPHRKFLQVISQDILLIVLGSILLIILFALRNPHAWIEQYLLPIRLLLTLIFVLFIPGYLLQALFFPALQDLDELERAGISLGLSLAVLSILALVIEYSPWKLEMQTIAFCQVWVILFLSSLVMICRATASRKMAEEMSFHEQKPQRVSSIKNKNWQPISILLSGTLFFGLLFGMIYLENSNKKFMTEFYILGTDGLAEGFPLETKVDQPLHLTLGINNLEKGTASYTLRINSIEEQLASSELIILESGQSWHGQLVFEFSRPGEDQPVDILLMREGAPDPYRSLRIWVNVHEDREPLLERQNQHTE